MQHFARPSIDLLDLLPWKIQEYLGAGASNMPNKRFIAFPRGSMYSYMVYFGGFKVLSIGTSGPKYVTYGYLDPPSLKFCINLNHSIETKSKLGIRHYFRPFYFELCKLGWSSRVGSQSVDRYWALRLGFD